LALLLSPPALYLIADLPGRIRLQGRGRYGGNEMEEIVIRIVGTDESPIKIYWDYKNRKIDGYLLIMSVVSGAYGKENHSFSTFKDMCIGFFKKTKYDETYKKQLIFVLENSSIECADYLNNMLRNKWNLNIQYENKNTKYEIA
jgi:hypothetical protein